MGRVLRLLRLVKTIQGFDALHFGRRDTASHPKTRSCATDCGPGTS